METQQPAFTRLGYMGVEASDMEAWRDFATNVLGMQLSSEGADGTLYFRMDMNHYRLAVHPGPSDDFAYSGWQVPHEEALGAFFNWVTGHGHEATWATPEELAARKVGGMFHFKDPSGVRLEAFFGAQVDYQHPFQPFRPISGFVTGDQGLGHYVMRMDDFETSRRFYHDVAGMRVSDFVERMTPQGDLRKLIFFHCNPRHHSLGFSSGPGGARRLGHIMIEVGELDDLGRTYDLAMERGIADTSIGRHPNDRQVSFYLRTPSGWLIEYGWGARPVDDATNQVEKFTVISLWGHKRADGTKYGEPPAARAKPAQ